MSEKENKIDDLEKIAEKYKKRNKYINEWQKTNYYRLTVLIPLADKEKITQAAKSKNYKTVSDYIKALIDDDINGAGAGSAIIPDYIPTQTKIVDYSAEVLSAASDDDIQPQAEKKPAQAATKSALESRLDRLLNDHT